jgi:hypothetical protein
MVLVCCFSPLQDKTNTAAIWYAFIGLVHAREACQPTCLHPFCIFAFFETPGEKPHGQGLCALSPANADSRLAYRIDLRTAGDGSIQPRRLAASSQPRLWMLSLGFLFKALCEQAFRGKLCRFSFSSVRAFWFHDA